MSVNFFGDDDRTLSQYEYQTKKNMAFENTLYIDDAIKRVAEIPPTKLIQSYYSCVKSRWQAVYEAGGLAFSNTQLYIGIAILVYMYVSVLYFRRIQQNEEKVRWKIAKLKEEELKKKHLEDFVEALQRDVKEGFIAGSMVHAKRSLEEAEKQLKEELEKHDKEGANIMNYVSAVGGGD